MNQTPDTNSWVRIAFVLLGIFAIIMGVWTSIPVVRSLAYIPLEGWNAELAWILVVTLLAPAVMCVCAYILIRYCHHFASRLNAYAACSVPYWERAVYRLLSTFFGILLIALALPELGQVVLNLMSAERFEGQMDLRTSAIALIVRISIQTLFGLYLLLGAPHLIKWQLRRVARAEAQEQMS